jgi:diacylglycerol kinase
MANARQALGKAFIVAFKGIAFAFRHERNVKIHSLSTVLVYAAGWYFKVNRLDYLWLTSAVALVWVTELLNTSIEQLTNLVHPEQHPTAGRVKDLAAAAVLLASIYAVTVAILIFFPYIFSDSY